MKKISLLFVCFLAVVTGLSAQDKIGEYTYDNGTHIYLYRVNAIDEASKSVVGALKIEAQTASDDNLFGNKESENFEFQIKKTDIQKALGMIKKFQKEGAAEIDQLKLENDAVMKLRKANGELMVDFELAPDKPGLVFSFYEKDFLKLTLAMEEILKKL